MSQPFGFSFSDAVLAEAAGVPLRALHFDVDAICAAYDAIRPVAERLGVSVPRPRLAGFREGLGNGIGLSLSSASQLCYHRDVTPGSGEYL